MNFTSEKINERLYRIKDAFGVAMYLVIGEQKCMLIDTGYGVPGLKDYIHTLCKLPVIVCLSHGHIDHAMGAGEFHEIYMNPADIGCFHRHADEHLRKSFRDIFFPEIQIDVIPASNKDFLPLADGMVFDLGDIHVEAISTPGHTLGTMMFLIKEDRSIIFGDGCGPGTLLMEDFSTDISTYISSLEKIKKIEDSYDTIYRFHGTCISEKCLLDNVLQCCKDILQGKDEKIQITDENVLSLLNPAYIETYMARNPKYEDGNITYRKDKVK